MIIPFDTAQPDLDGALNAIKLVPPIAKTSKSKMTAVFVANRYDARTNISKEIIDVVKKSHPNYPDEQYKTIYDCPYLTGFKQMQTHGGLPIGKALSAAKKNGS